MSILCATDFSPCAQAAADIAVLFAKKLNLPLRLVHCGRDYIVMGDLPVVIPDDEPMIHRLHVEATRLREAGVEVTEDFRHGSTVSELVEAAEEEPTELIVLGFAGRSAGRTLLGSIAESVAESAPFPTLVVHQPDVLRDWLRNQSELELMCGIDLAGSSDAALEWVKKLAGIGHVKVGAAHVHLAENADTTSEEHQAHERDVWDQMQARLPGVPLTVHVRETANHPTQHFLDLVTEKRAGLVVVGSHQRHGLKRLTTSSFSRRVLAHSGTNVLCVPTRGTADATSIPVIQRVLLAADLEDLTSDVLRHACSLLPESGALKLVHVCQDPTSGINPVIATEVYFNHSMDAAKAREEAAQKIKALPPALLNVPGIRFTSEVLTHHDVADAICSAADRFGADAICMGTRGRSRVASALLGSTAQGVLARTSKPVFVIPPPAA